MRVAMYYNNRDVRIEELPRPRIGAGEMLVKVNATGICGSDVLEWYRTKSAPRVLGHEIAAEVMEVGEGVTRFAPGERVFVTHHVPCNTCRYCLEQKHTICETLHTTTFDPGGFAEYLRVPAINVDRGTFHLPESVSDDAGVFVEPLACVVRGQRLADVHAGQTLLILGSGFSGLLHQTLARSMGVDRIIVTDLSEYRLDLARRLGATAAIHAGEDVPAAVREDNEGRLADRVIVCAGAKAAYEQALQSVDRGGTILCFAPTDPEVELVVPFNDYWRNGITLLPTYAGAGYDIQQAIDFLSAGMIPVEEMITHRLPLEDAQQGFDLVANPSDSMKVILYPFGTP